MTLMSEKIGDGAMRRCDSRCYSAKHDKCVCICGGVNHRAGLRLAMENVRKVFLPVLEKRGIKVGKLVARQIEEERQQMVFNYA
jgi:hypothetical protein